MKSIYVTCLAAALMSFGVSACTGASDHGHGDDHSHGTEGHSSSHAEHTSDHSKFGHFSAVYQCGNHELQTKHTDAETTVSYLGKTVEASRTVSILDDAFAGETFKGKLNGQSFIFKGKGYDASIDLGGEITICEKLTCIPLGVPH